MSHSSNMQKRRDRRGPFVVDLAGTCPAATAGAPRPACPLADGLPIMLWMTDAVGNRTWANREWLDFTGGSLAQECDRGWMENVHPDDLELLKRARSAPAGQESRTTIEYRVRRHDGRYRWITETTGPVRSEGQPVTGFLSTAVDITERREDLARLKDLSERVNLVARAAHEAIWDWNLVTNQVWWSEGLRNLFGAALEDRHAGFDFRLDRIHPDDRERVLTGLHRAIESGDERWSDEYRFSCLNGRYAFVTDRGFIVRDAAGRATRMVGSMTDLTTHWRLEEELRASAERRETILRTAMDGFFTLNTDGQLREVNDSYLRMVGFSRSELLQMRLHDLETPESGCSVEAFMQRVREKGPDRFESRHRRKDGSVVEVEISAHYLPAEGGQFFVFARDITERRKTEELLRLNHAAVNAAANAIIITDPDGIIRWVNPAFTRLTGYCATEVIGGKPSLLKSGQHPPEYYQKLWQTITAGQVWQGEGGNRRKDGTHYVEEMTITPVIGESNRIAAFIAIKQDVSERNAAQAKLREQAVLLDQAHDAILVRDLDDVVRYWNQGAENLFGWSAVEAVGRKTAELFDTVEPALEAARATVLRNGEWSGDLIKTTRDGRRVVCEARWTLVRNDVGEPQSILVIITDITEKTRLAAQFLRAQRLESVGQLASGIAHDLNNILMPILLVTPMLRDRLTDRESASLLDTLETSALRGAGIVKQVLTFSRGFEGERRPVQLRHLLKEFARIIAETFPRSIKLKLEEQNDLWLVKGDSTQLHQVLMNLCVNARDAMPDGGILTIHLRNVVLDPESAGLIPGAKPGPHVLLRVSDTGTGISPASLDRVFDPFFTTKESGKGTGLGLSTVLGIVQTHDGFIQVNSLPKEGTDFIIHLPAMDALVESPEEKDQPDPPKGRGELVLVVDDEPNVRELCKKTLEKNGYRVLLARDGLEAVERFQQHKHDIKIVLTDLAMPRMDGMTLIHALRSEPPYPAIIATSGLIPGSDAETPQDVLLRKPFTTGALLRALRASIDKEQPDGSVG